MTDVVSAGDPKEPAFFPSGRRIGDYLLGQMIGTGGTGTVFLARQISMQRFAAVKILREDYSADPLYAERFFQEVRLLAKLEHAGIIRIWESGMDKGICFYAMEYVNGRDLKTELNIRGKLTEREVLTMARDISLAMAYAWNRFRIVHRDIKPANIMREKSGTIRLLDPGISKQVCHNTAPATEKGTAAGSPAYISPEQAGGQNPPDFRSDIYSLGITMYHLISGHLPFDSPIPAEVIAMHINAPVPELKNECPVLPGTSALIRDMMSKKSGDRSSSWEEITERAESLLDQLDAVPSVVPLRKNAYLNCKMLACILFVAGIFLILALAVVYRFIH